ncbi:MAG TPA: hypothetical protein P5567_07165 [Kiritimatiellia bacterium]|nr:hypothetical protein [Kiritimatiellia bacterium]HSA18023.1 hypothetical protein [Kiritimatiellia bacterium]
MKMLLVGVALALGGTAAVAEAPPAPSEAAPQAAVEALKQLSAEVQEILVRENVHSMFDRTARLQELGLSYQPDLVAPAAIDPAWTRCQQQQFAGIKLFDAVYAIAFQKRQETADAMRALEEIITGLDLRSHADFSGRSYATLQKAAEDPGAIDVQALLDELANNLADEIPVTMSSPVTAHFLMDSLYGFSIESAHVMGYFQRNDATGKLRAQLYEEPSQPGREPWMKMVLRAFAAFERQAAALGLECDAPGKLDVVRSIAQVVEDEQAGRIPPETGAAIWNEIGEQIAAMRRSILRAGAGN